MPECDCDALAQQVYEMSCNMSSLFEQNDNASRTVVDLLAPGYARRVMMLGKACPEKACELKQEYEHRLRIHNVTPEIFEIGPTPELTKRDAKIVREIVRSNLRYDQNALRSKMGWGQWFATAFSQRPRW